MKAETIIDKLYNHFSKYDYQISNSYIFRWESDFFCISKAGYCYEVEVKVSRSDFKADFKKHEKHQILSSKRNLVTIKGYESLSLFDEERNRYVMNRPNCRVYFKNQDEISPNKFFYACPKGLISKDEIPEYAGLIEIEKQGEKFLRLRVAKNAPFIHKNKLDLTKTLLDKFYYAYQNLRINEAFRKYEFEQLKKQVS